MRGYVSAEPSTALKIAFPTRISSSASSGSSPSTKRPVAAVEVGDDPAVALSRNAGVNARRGRVGQRHAAGGRLASEDDRIAGERRSDAVEVRRVEEDEGYRAGARVFLRRASDEIHRARRVAHLGTLQTPPFGSGLAVTQ
jgi:hypothetical protein